MPPIFEAPDYVLTPKPAVRSGATGLIIDLDPAAVEPVRGGSASAPVPLVRVTGGSVRSGAAGILQ